MTLGSRLKLLRESEHMTQKELAERLHMSNSTLCQYESGARVPSDEVKANIADFFGVSVDYLLGRESKDPLKRWAAKQKEEAATQQSDGPADDDARLLRLLTKADPDLKKAMIEFLEKAQK